MHIIPVRKIKAYIELPVCSDKSWAQWSRSSATRIDGKTHLNAQGQCNRAWADYIIPWMHGSKYASHLH